MPATTVGELLRALDKKMDDNCESVVVLKGDQTIEEAILVLSKNNILSAPVISSTQQFMGIVDVHDMLDIIVAAYKEDNCMNKSLELLARPVSSIPKSQPPDISFIAAGIGFHETLTKCVNERFLAQGTHRVAISDCDARVLNVFSQSDIMRYHLMNPTQHEQKLNKPLSAFPAIVSKSVVSITIGDRAIDALLAMHRENVRVVAIVAERGQLHSQINTGALRGLRSSDIPCILENVLTFLEKVKARFIEKGTAPREIVKVAPTTTLLDTMKQMTDGKAHEAFIVGEEDELQSVITFTDILRVLYAEV